jgi:hypothetical protein
VHDVNNYKEMAITFKIDFLEDHVSNEEIQIIQSHLGEIIKLVMQQENLIEEKVS